MCSELSCSTQVGPNGESIWLCPPDIALGTTVAVVYVVPALVPTWHGLIKYRSFLSLCALIGLMLEVDDYMARIVSTKRVAEIVSNHFVSIWTRFTAIMAANDCLMQLGSCSRQVWAAHPP